MWTGTHTYSDRFRGAMRALHSEAESGKDWVCQAVLEHPEASTHGHMQRVLLVQEEELLSS